MIKLRQHRFAFILLGLVAAVGVVAPLFLIAGCRTLQQTPQELQARSARQGGNPGGGGIDGFFAAYVPGYDSVAFPEGTG